MTTPAPTLVPAEPFPRVALVDHTGTYGVAELMRVAEALQVQVMRDFALPPPYGWGLPAAVRAAHLALPHEWVLGLFADADQPGALGYHDETPTGMPLAKVFPFVDSSAPWSSIASHELLEMLADPLVCRAAQAADGRFFALEVCDAVEEDLYDVDGVRVSDFVLPAYFEPPRSTSGLKLDHLGLIKSPYELRPGGYNQWYSPGDGWQMVQADRRSAYRGAVTGRAARRRAAYYEADPSPLKSP